MKIAVLGCGAMGGLYGAYLSKQNEVTVIDVNNELVKKINEKGLVVSEPDKSSNTYYPKAVLKAEQMEAVDLVIVFVKAIFSESALQANRNLIGPNTKVMTLQNGSGHEAVLEKFVPEENIIIGSTQHNASMKELGISEHGGSGKTYIGALKKNQEDLQSIAENFKKCGLDTEVSSDVQKIIWNKMFTNVSASALTALLQVPLGYIYEDQSAWKICCDLIEEAVQVAEAMGMHFDMTEKVDEVRQVCINSPKGLTSIYMDLKNGRKTEVDTISGSIVRAGFRCGIPTPNHSMVVNMIHAMENRKEF